MLYFLTEDPTSRKCTHCNTTSFDCENFHFGNFFQYQDLDLSIDARLHRVKAERSQDFAEFCRVAMMMLTENLNITNVTFDWQCMLRWRESNKNQCVFDCRFCVECYDDNWSDFPIMQTTSLKIISWISWIIKNHR